MTDIKERLRDPYIVLTSMVVRLEAADEIERLEYDNEQLHLALQLVKDTAIPEMERMRELLGDIRKWMNRDLGDWDFEFIDRIDAILGQPHEGIQDDRTARSS